MDILWHGHSCFTIKGSEATIVTDPYEGLGQNLPDLKANIVSLCDKKAAAIGRVKVVAGNPVIFDWPGEFEAAGVAIEGHAVGEETCIYVFTIDGIKIAHLSGLNEALPENLTEEIGDVDILLLPVGGGDVLEAKQAQDIIESIEPRVIIPMYFMETASSLNINGAHDFLRALGKSEMEAVKKFSLSKRSDLPEDSMSLVLLSCV